jgi:hypothetical protein
MHRIRLVEAELVRINRIVRNPDYNPVDVLQLSPPFSPKDVKASYFRIVRLIHPDKNWNLDRFCRAFDVVNGCYRTLIDDGKQKICVDCKKNHSHSNVTLLKELRRQNDGQLRDGTTVGCAAPDGAAETRLVKWQPGGALCVFKNNVSQQQLKVSVHIAIDGAAHTKNKCKSKADKHEKGLRQRATQRKNAEKRIQKHQFAFTDKVTLEILPEKKTAPLLE